ncbi:TonB-dependent receptor [Niveispirillum sp.]|uniref:TonB-dependent receptor n=1 Tax=Niveispirillum sp. TaxID=1917217 RepID=UPI001B767BB7|nr:TonB-dependent receptor [Niveispirillum sp.]MBP7337915.1 TonB-dependent receptor [Niveispirillum sp.]
MGRRWEMNSRGRAVPGIGVAIGLGAGLLATTAPVATAQETQAESFTLEEIVVTARRRAESLQEAPVAITALTDQMLTDRNIGNVLDIGRQAPNLQISTGRSSSSVGFVFIRGIGQADDNPSADPGVAQYVDDVYLGRLQGALVSISDVASVEVLRGPQGTLYGKNTIGGAIKINSKLPGPEAEGRIGLAYGRFDEVKASASVSGPVVEDKLFMRVSAERLRNDGFMRNALTGERTNNTDSLSGRAMLRYTPTEDVDLLLSLDGSRNRAEPYNGFLAATLPTSLNALINRYIGPMNSYVKPVDGDIWRGSFDISADPAITMKPFEDVWGASLRASVGDEKFTVKSITAYREIDRERLVDADASPLTVTNFSDHLDQWQFSQEFQLSGEFAGGSVKWLAGAFYYQEDVEQLTLGNFFPALIAVNPALNQTVRQSLALDTKSYAAFANVTWDMTEKLSGTLGLRYTREDKGIAIQSARLNTGQVFFGPISNDDRFTDTSPKFEVDYKWTPELFTYASVSKGFKSGGFNGRAGPFGQLDPYKPESAWAYELGVKSQWFDRRLTLNLAGFYTDYKNIQLQVMTVQNGNLFQLTTNAGKAHIQGLEAEVNLRPAAGVNLYASGGITDAQYDEYYDARLGDVSDRAFAYTPKYNLLIGGNWEQSVSDTASAFLDVNYSYRSRTWYDPQNTVSIAQGGYGLLNARAALRLRDGDLEIALYGKNLTDKRYIQSGVSFLDSFGFSLAYAGAPRTYGLEVNYRF